MYIPISEDGTRKTDLPSGINHIDFKEGILTDSAGTQTVLRRALKNNDEDYIRSVAVFVPYGTKLTLGTEVPVKVNADEGWNIFENVAIEQMTIEIPFAATPDTYDFQIVASTSRKIQLKPLHLKHIDSRNGTATATANAHAGFIERNCPAFNHQTFVIAETGGVNGITYKIEAILHSGGTYVEIQGDTAVAASANDVVAVEGAYYRVKLSCKSTVGGSHGEVTAQWIGQG